MERLTKRDECGQALFAKSANDYEFPIEAVADVLNRLAEYEDSGLEAYHIPGVLADCHKLVEECRNLKAKNSRLKHLIKLAVDDIEGLFVACDSEYNKHNKLTVPENCKYCKNYSENGCVNDAICKWRYADEAKKEIYEM